MGYILEQMQIGIERSIRLRKERGDDPIQIIKFLEKLIERAFCPQLKLFLFTLMWAEVKESGLLGREA